MIGENPRMFAVAIAGALPIFLVCGSVLAQEVEEEPSKNDSKPTTPVTLEQQPNVIVYAAPKAPTVANTQQETVADPLQDLRKQPKRLRPIEGQEPPPGYVEVERKNRKLIIAGSIIFGVTYISCLSWADSHFLMAIPLAGPMIVGFSYKHSDPNDPVDDEIYDYRLYGTLGTIAQVTGVALFTAGMFSKKKHWLRQDVAGVSYSISPTVVGNYDPGVGISGSF